MIMDKEGIVRPLRFKLLLNLAMFLLCLCSIYPPCRLLLSLAFFWILDSGFYDYQIPEYFLVLVKTKIRVSNLNQQ